MKLLATALVLAIIIVACGKGNGPSDVAVSPRISDDGHRVSTASSAVSDMNRRCLTASDPTRCGGKR